MHFLDRNGYVVEVPPIVPDSFEALAAAIYFDSSMNLNVVANVCVDLCYSNYYFGYLLIIFYFFFFYIFFIHI